VLASAAAAPATAVDEAEALASIGPEAPVPEPAAAGGWRLAFEAAAEAEREASGAHRQRLRATLDHRWAGQPAPRLRALLSGRLDLRGGDGGGQALHVLREAYLAWQPDPVQTWSLGRRIWRHGGAPGFSPGDLLRSGAFRLDAALSPFDAELLRMGPIGLAYERRWAGGALALLHAPRLSTRPSNGALSVDAAATNAGRRTLVAVSQRVSEAVAPQLLLLQEEGRGPRAALNLSLLATPSTVLQVEAAQQRTRLLPLPSQGGPMAGAAHWQGTAGLTHTANERVTVWAAVHHNAAAPDRAAWQPFVAAAVPLQRAEYHALAELGQELPARQAWSAGGSWRGHLGRAIEARGFVIGETATRSRSWWLEGAWRGSDREVVLRLNLHDGAGDSIYGSSPRRARATLAWNVPLR
jgi:hypothetical protein